METDFFPPVAQENVSRGFLTVRYAGWGEGDVRRWSQGVKSYLRLIFFFRPRYLFVPSLVSVIATKSNELGFASQKG